MRDLHVSFPKPCAENWETMTPAGRARVCARCDKAVHDLSRYTLDEAEPLLRGSGEVCVRARVGADGSVALKPGRRNDARRMVVAVAATAGLLAATAPALARETRPAGAIAGKVESGSFRVRVFATGANGQTFRTKVKGNGQFRIKHLPAGPYTLSFHPDCGDSWTFGEVVVRDGETIVPDVKDENQCIVVGLLQIEESRG